MANRNTPEDRVIAGIDKQSVFNELWPAIQLALKHGGGSDAILRKSQAVAAAKMIEALYSDKDDVRLRAAEKILDRVNGRPVERKINVYGDLADLNERELDSQIKRLVRDSGASSIIDAVVSEAPKAIARKKLKQDAIVKGAMSDPIPEDDR